MDLKFLTPSHGSEVPNIILSQWFNSILNLLFWFFFFFFWEGVNWYEKIWTYDIYSLMISLFLFDRKTMKFTQK